MVRQILFADYLCVKYNQGIGKAHMKYLVTGGAGFIGSSIVDALVAKGHDVVVVDNLCTGFLSNLEKVRNRIQFVEGDIRNLKLLNEVMQGVDIVCHQAALKTVPESFDRPHEYNEVNISATLSLLEAAVKFGVKKFVYASSSSVYGGSPSLPKRETDVQGPVSPYGVSKLSCEHYCNVFTSNYGLPTVSLRYFNVFGPRQPEKDGYSPVIPKFIACMLRDEMPPVYGDGTQSRDFTYIDNVVLANMLAMEKVDVTGVFNVGMGENHSLLTVIDLLNEILGKKIAPQFLPGQKGDVKHTLASLDLIQAKLGYKSKLSFKEGLKRTMERVKSL